jgi:Mg2+ and Co2+ transporter CorA
MTPEDEAFNDIERMAEVRRKAVSAALKEHQEHMLKQVGDYERGLMDGRRMQSRLDKAVKAMSKREWVGLTDEELDVLHRKVKIRLMGTFDTKDIYRAIEAELKEKNT